MQNEKTVRVTIGEGVAVIKREGVSRPTVANILGMELDQDGKPAKVYLDRVVHKISESKFVGFRVEGAVSTILTALQEPAVQI